MTDTQSYAMYCKLCNHWWLMTSSMSTKKMRTGYRTSSQCIPIAIRITTCCYNSILVRAVWMALLAMSTSTPKTFQRYLWERWWLKCILWPLLVYNVKYVKLFSYPGCTSSMLHSPGKSICVELGWTWHWMYEHRWTSAGRCSRTGGRQTVATKMDHVRNQKRKEVPAVAIGSTCRDKEHSY